MLATQSFSFVLSLSPAEIDDIELSGLAPPVSAMVECDAEKILEAVN